MGGLDPPLLSPVPSRKGSRSESFHFRREEFYPSSNPREEAIYGLSLLLVLILGVCFSKVLVIIAPGDGLSLNVLLG